ncbi:MAG TPA: ParB N-terminal domain-containing protein [Candidatus Dormibacteraeota bacterium]|nr:ParB N-terminal domain-containing protein [Candidatus Dormibacteraeota bacterium]
MSEQVLDELAVDEIRGRGWRDLAGGEDPSYRVLLSSVRSRGVLEPLVVRTHPEGGFQLVSGARRLQAAREAGRATVPVVVRELGDAEALIGGAWAALTRTGVSEDEAGRLRGELLAAGVAEDDVDLLAGSLPRSDQAVELTGRGDPGAAVRSPAWAWTDATGEAEQPRRGRLRLRRGR